MSAFGHKTGTLAATLWILWGKSVRCYAQRQNCKLKHQLWKIDFPESFFLFSPKEIDQSSALYIPCLHIPDVAFSVCSSTSNHRRSKPFFYSKSLQLKKSVIQNSWNYINEKLPNWHFANDINLPQTHKIKRRRNICLPWTQNIQLLNSFYIRASLGRPGPSLKVWDLALDGTVFLCISVRQASCCSDSQPCCCWQPCSGGRVTLERE